MDVLGAYCSPQLTQHIRSITRSATPERSPDPRAETSRRRAGGSGRHEIIDYGTGHISRLSTPWVVRGGESRTTIHLQNVIIIAGRRHAGVPDDGIDANQNEAGQLFQYMLDQFNIGVVDLIRGIGVFAALMQV